MAVTNKFYDDLSIAVLNINTNTNNVVIPKVAGKRILVFGWFFTTAGTVSLTWKKGSIALSGPMPFFQGGGHSQDVRTDQRAYFATTDDTEDLVIALSANVLVAGTVYYLYRDI